TSHRGFPVINDARNVIGMVTAKGVDSEDEALSVDKIMAKKPITIHAETSLAYVADLMVWEGIELIRVVGSAHDLQGLVSRQDVLKALNEVQRQPQVGETIHDLSSQGLKTVEGKPTVFETDVTPQMTNQIGTLSYGV